MNLIKAAVNDTDGKVWFKEVQSTAMGRIAETGDFETPSLTIDTLVLRGKIPLSVIKLDVEGGEYHALLAAMATIDQARPKIFLATHGREVHRKCSSLLLSIGYELVSLDERSIQDTDELLVLPQQRTIRVEG